MKGTILKINKTKSWFLEKIKLANPQPEISKKIKNKREKNHISNIRNEKGATTDNAEIQRIIRDYSIHFISITQSCLTLCDPMDCSMPGFLVHHQLPELVQTHVHHIGDAIQRSHLLSSPFLLPSIFPSIGVFSDESVL